MSIESRAGQITKGRERAADLQARGRAAKEAQAGEMARAALANKDKEKLAKAKQKEGYNKEEIEAARDMIAKLGVTDEEIDQSIEHLKPMKSHEEKTADAVNKALNRFESAEAGGDESGDLNPSAVTRASHEKMVGDDLEEAVSKYKRSGKN